MTSECFCLLSIQLTKKIAIRMSRDTGLHQGAGRTREKRNCSTYPSRDRPVSGAAVWRPREGDLRGGWWLEFLSSAHSADTLEVQPCLTSLSITLNVFTWRFQYD